MAVAAERDIQIVTQPRRQGDVPTPPEIRKADGGVRKAEIVGHGEPQAHGGAYRGRRVAGEVAEDLPTECKRCGPGIEEARDFIAVVDTLGDARKKTIGEDHLVE